MKYKWRLLYYPPFNEMIADPSNIDKWPKVFYISIYDCPSKLDLAVKINELVKLYHMDRQYIVLEDLEDLEEND